MQEEKSKQPTCAKRIDKYYEETIKDVARVWDDYCTGESEEFNDYGLCFDYMVADGASERGYFRWQLPWGGSSDEFRFYVDYSKHVSFIEYWFLDWYDGASIALCREDYDLLSEIYDNFEEIGAVDNAYKEATDE